MDERRTQDLKSFDFTCYFEITIESGDQTDMTDNSIPIANESGKITHSFHFIADIGKISEIHSEISRICEKLKCGIARRPNELRVGNQVSFWMDIAVSNRDEALAEFRRALPGIQIM